MTRAASFPYRPVALGLALVLAGCASGAAVRFKSTARSEPELSGILYRPEGTGPFPAVVLLHTCGGLQPHVFSWARWLMGEGYVALLLDSFSAPGRSSNCVTRRNPTVLEVADDAFGALAYLRSQPFVASDRVAVMGLSLGAGAALITATMPGPARFRGAVAFYACRQQFTAVNIPVLLLLGGADTDNEIRTPDCVENARVSQEMGRPVSWKVYPQATHGFDKAELGSQTSSKGYRYDAAATADAEKEVRAFLARHLRGSP